MIRGREGTCALLGTPIHSPYRDFGLDLSQEAFDGPTRESYPGGFVVTNSVERRAVRGSKTRQYVRVHSVMIDGDWGMLEATFTKERFIHRASKFFGKQEPQGGDPLFDDNIFVTGDTSDSRLAFFINNDHVQSALMAMVLGPLSATVHVEPGTMEYEFTTGDDGEYTDYKTGILPMLALAVWATRTP